MRPAWRRCEVGRALLADALRALRDQGVSAVELEVNSENQSGALGAYQNAGMRWKRVTHTLLKEVRAGADLTVNG